MVVRPSPLLASFACEGHTSMTLLFLERARERRFSGSLISRSERERTRTETCKGRLRFGPVSRDALWEIFLSFLHLRTTSNA